MDTNPVSQTNGYTTLATATNDPAEKGTSNGVAIVPARDLSPLLALPREMISRIVNYLSHRDVMAIEETCRYLRDIAAPILTARSRPWYKHFEPLQQQQFTQIAKNISKHELRAWLMQFTRDEMLVSSLCRQLAEEMTDEFEARNPQNITLFPQRLFYLVGQFMNDSPVLQPVLVSDIQCKSYKVDKATLSHGASYLVTNCYGADCSAKIHVLAAKNIGYLQIPIPHGGWVRQVTLSADNCHILSHCTTRTVKITSRSANNCWAEQLAISHKDEIRSATFSPDSRNAVTASGDNSACIGSVDQDGRWALTARITHDGDVRSANFSPDSTLLVTASEDHTARIYRRADNGTWRRIATLQHNGKVISAKFSPDGKHIITVSDNQNNDSGQTATIYSVNPDGRWTKKAVITHSGRICSASFSPDSRHAVTASRDHTVNIFNCDTDNNWQIKEVIKHTGRVSSASFSPNSLLLITTSDHSAKIYGFDANQRSWSEQLTIEHKYKISSTQFSADNRHILAVSGNDSEKPNNHCTASIHSRNASGEWLQSANIEPESGVYSGQFNHDGSHVVINECAGKALILGYEADGKWSHKAGLDHQYALNSAEFSANSSHLVTISRRGKQIKVWRLYGKDVAPPSPSKRKHVASPVLPPVGKKARKSGPQVNG